MTRTLSALASLALVFGLTACDAGPQGELQCESLCDLTPTATPLEGACVSSFITSRGYDTDHPDCVALSDAFARGAATTAQCNACYRSIGVAGAHCSDARSMCFGSVPPPDGGPQPMTDGGPLEPDAGPLSSPDAGPLSSPDAGPLSSPDAGGSGVDSCSDLCALTATTTAFEAECTSDFIRSLGYDVTVDPCRTLAAAFGAGVANAAMCDACYAEIAVIDGHCAAAHDSCF